jgi:hypothetical protein
MGKSETHVQLWSKVLKRRDQFEDLCVGGRIILKWMLKEGCELRVDLWAGCYEYADESSGSTKGGIFLK